MTKSLLLLVLLTLSTPTQAFTMDYIYTVCTKYGTGMNGLVEMGKFVNTDCGYF